jgi:hypothetical protein
MKLTAKDVLEYQERVNSLKISKQFTANNYKALGRELRDKYNLTDRQAIDILNGKNDVVLTILAELEKK